MSPHSKSFVFCALLAIANSLPCNGLAATADAGRWEFVTMGGQALVIVYDGLTSTYRVTLGDITHVGEGCDSGREYLVCLISDSLEVAIPRQRPNLGDSWRVEGVVFSLLKSHESLRLFGEVYDDVHVIGVTKDWGYYFPGITKAKHMRLFFSYDAGLLAFHELENTESLPIFLASDLPSLGANDP